MPEFKRMGDYSMKKIGEGAESEAFRPKNRLKKDSREKGIVIKNMIGLKESGLHPDERKWDIDEEGFDDHYKEILREHHEKLRAEYGDIIPHARFIKNPDVPELNLIAQEHIELAEPPGVEDYYPVDIEDEALKAKIADFVEKVKKNMTLSLARKPAIIPDLDNNNLAFTKNIDRMVYLDSGLFESTDIRDDTILRVARLAMLGGAQPDALRRDPFFHKTFKKFPELATIDEEHEFYNALLEGERKRIDKEAEGNDEEETTS